MFCVNNHKIKKKNKILICIEMVPNQTDSSELTGTDQTQSDEEDVNRK